MLLLDFSPGQGYDAIGSSAIGVVLQFATHREERRIRSRCESRDCERIEFFYTTALSADQRMDFHSVFW